MKKYICESVYKHLIYIYTYFFLILGLSYFPEM